ncbi:hypothetical protein ABK040_008462 [Willaertia magna]
MSELNPVNKVRLKVQETFLTPEAKSNSLPPKCLSSWINCCFDGGHAIYLIQDEYPPFAYTIGLEYWYNLPEVLVIMDTNGIDDFNPRIFGNLINGIADFMKMNPNFLVDQGTKIKELFPTINSEATFERAKKEENCNDYRNYLGFCNWFYVNFADYNFFKCLKIILTSNDVKEVINYFESADSVVKKIYNSTPNVVYLKHGPVTTIPEVIPPSKQTLILGKMMSLGKNVEESEFENLTDLTIEDEYHFYKAAGCNLELLKKIIEANPQYNMLCDEALSYAMWNNRLDNLKYLIELGCNLKGNGVERSILMDAVQNGFEEAVHILVEAGAPLEDIDCEKWTPLSISSQAILHEDLEKAKRITQYLWDKGAREM